MRDLPLSSGLACFIAAYGLVTAPAARAATAYSNIAIAGSECQLSIPTIDTKSRPKATGFRNESTTANNFVICPVQVEPAQGNNVIKDVSIVVYTLDGVSHDVNCTAATNSQGATQYSSKSITAANTTWGNYVAWNAVDFGGTAGDAIPGSLWFSVTCLLPSQSAINYLYASYAYEIGT